MATSFFNKAILLAGGRGTRLDPLTRAMNKHLLPVHDKPMIYYPLATLLAAGLREVLLITAPRDVEAFRRLLGDGSHLGISIRYAEQSEPRGIAEALVIARAFAGTEPIALALGDNLFVGRDLAASLSRAAARRQGATVFAAPVEDPACYGIVELDAAGRAVGIEEKPPQARSNLGVAGLYFYDSRARDVAAHLTPGARGELEITDVNRDYLARGELHVELLPADVRWFDAGTHASLAKASTAVDSYETAHRCKLGCIEEVAWRQRFIDDGQLARLADERPGDYGRYLRNLLCGAAE